MAQLQIGDEVVCGLIPFKVVRVSMSSAWAQRCRTNGIMIPGSPEHRFVREISADGQLQPIPRDHGWHFSRWRLSTPEIREEARRAQVIRNLKEEAWQELPTATLDQIGQLIARARKIMAGSGAPTDLEKTDGSV